MSILLNLWFQIWEEAFQPVSSRFTRFPCEGRWQGHHWTVQVILCFSKFAPQFLREYVPVPLHSELWLRNFCNLRISNTQLLFWFSGLCLRRYGSMFWRSFLWELLMEATRRSSLLFKLSFGSSSSGFNSRKTVKEFWCNHNFANLAVLVAECDTLHSLSCVYYKLFQF